MILLFIIEQKHHFILQQSRNEGSITGPQSVVTFYLGTVFLDGRLLEQQYVGNNGKTLIGTVKRWPRSLKKGGR